MAAKAYNIAQLMEKEGDREAQLKWKELVARLVYLSLEPKKLAELEEIKKVLAEIKRQRDHEVSWRSLPDTIPRLWREIEKIRSSAQ